jgi:hypothetical protein
MPVPDPKWSYPEWIAYFRDDLKNSVKTDIRPLLATEGSFGAPRQFFPYIEYLSGLVYGPAGGGNLANTKYAIRFFRGYMAQIDPLYRKYARILLDMWRHGLIHRYQPKLLQRSPRCRIGWLSYFGDRHNHTEEWDGTPFTMSHLTPLRIPGRKMDYFPVSVRDLVEDLEQVMDLIVTQLTAEQATNRRTRLRNMKKAATFLANPERVNYRW